MIGTLKLKQKIGEEFTYILLYRRIKINSSSLVYLPLRIVKITLSKNICW